MSEPDAGWVAAVQAGDVRKAARLISRIEARDEAVEPAVATLHGLGGHTPTFGFTGPPGAGKSTLVDQLIALLRKRGLRVAVLAVDPSSPFTGGAILGDRVRMGRHNTDPGVFIRSMAARGNLGGLARAAGDALLVLDAMGWDVILVETVGVGQNEIDIVRHADSIVLLQTPASGDELQAVKAGLTEVGDIFLVNKADTAGADRMVSALREAIGSSTRRMTPDAWQAPVLKTQAVDGTGLDALIDTMWAHREHLKQHPEQALARRRSQVRAQLAERLSDLLRRDRAGADEAVLSHWIEEVATRRCDPQTAARQLLRAGP